MLNELLDMGRSRFDWQGFWERVELAFIGFFSLVLFLWFWMNENRAMLGLGPNPFAR